MKIKSLKLKPKFVKTNTINLPGSKSISNRILLLSALSKGDTHIKNLLFSEDTKIMLKALKKLGIKIIEKEKSLECKVKGVNSLLPSKKNKLFVGNAGTVIRPLTSILTFNKGEYKLSGSDRMHERPIKDLIQSLQSIGGKIQYLKKDGYPPIHIKESKVNNHIIRIKGNISSQYLTSILLAGPIIAKEKDLEIIVLGKLISKPYVEITLKLMNTYGLKIKRKNYQNFKIPSKQVYKSPKNITVEGDASSATYFFGAAAISGKKIRVSGIGSDSIQGDIKFVNILKKMGAKIKISKNWIEVSSKKQLKAIDIDCNNIPDAAMTLAILALYAKGTTKIRNIGSWRVKETDRLSAMCKELKKLGARVKEGKDYLIINPPFKIKSASIDTYNDHRIAMCFSLASLNSIYKNGASIIIKNPKCVAKTFPDYFNYFNAILL